MENFIYVDESKIGKGLICDDCKKPFIDPVSLPCEQTFCLKCIQSNLQDHLNNCSECNRNNLTEQDFKPEGPRFRKILDNLLVKCSLCDQQDIQRFKFKEHIEQSCTKRLVFCRANDIKCPWNGPLDQLNEHLNICPYEQIRTDLTQLINDNQHLKQLQTDFDNLQNNLKQQGNTIQQVANANKSLNQQINEIKIEKDKLVEQSDQQINQSKIEKDQLTDKFDQQINLIKAEKDQLTEKSDQQLIEINQLNNQNAILNEQSEQQLNEINKLKNENNLLNDKIKQIQIENKQLNENCIQQLNEINNLKTEYKSLEDQCNQYQIKINDDENSLKNLVKSFQDKQNDFNLIENDNENLSQYLQQKQLEIEFLNKQIQELKQFEYIQRDYRNLHQLYQQQQIESIRQFNQQSIYIELIQTENEQLKQESIQYQIRIEQLIIEIKRLEAKLNKPIFQSKEFCNDNQIKELIEECQTKSLINLNGEIINDNNIEIIINIGLINKKCQAIILSNNNLTSNSIERLSSHLNINKTLTKLIISNNYLSNLSIKYLSESLSFNNSTLKQFILSSNQINDEGLCYLSDMFKSNQTISVFGLQDNQITDQSIEYFCKIIQFYNKTIEEISLYSNKLITDLSVDHINNMITNNNSLKTFWIWDCQLSKQGKDKIQQSIQTKIDFDLRL